MKGFLIIILFSALMLTGLIAIAVDKAYGQYDEPKHYIENFSESLKITDSIQVTHIEAIHDLNDGK